MPSGQKHLITCRCVLPQFKRAPDPPQHQFVVFSIVNDDDTIQPKFAQCNNCGIIHKVTEINRSEVVSRESMSSIKTSSDIKLGLPSNLVGLLEANDAELHTWEHAQFIIENKLWGDFIVLTTEVEDGLREGKYVRILGENMFKVDTFAREEVVK